VSLSAVISDVAGALLQRTVPSQVHVAQPPNGILDATLDRLPGRLDAGRTTGALFRDRLQRWIEHDCAGA